MTKGKWIFLIGMLGIVLLGAWFNPSGVLIGASIGVVIAIMSSRS